MTTLVVHDGRPAHQRLVNRFAHFDLPVVDLCTYSQFSFFLDSEADSSRYLVDGIAFERLSNILFLGYPEVPKYWPLDSADHLFVSSEYRAFLADALIKYGSIILNYIISGPNTHVDHNASRALQLIRDLGFEVASFRRLKSKNDKSEFQFLCSVFVSRKGYVCSRPLEEEIAERVVGALILPLQAYIDRTKIDWVFADVGLSGPDSVSCLDVSCYPSMDFSVAGLDRIVSQYLRPILTWKNC